MVIHYQLHRGKPVTTYPRERPRQNSYQLRLPAFRFHAYATVHYGSFPVWMVARGR